jgi:hypothetical protein
MKARREHAKAQRQQHQTGKGHKPKQWRKWLKWPQWVTKGLVQYTKRRTSLVFRSDFCTLSEYQAFNAQMKRFYLQHQQTFLKTHNTQMLPSHRGRSWR